MMSSHPPLLLTESSFYRHCSQGKCVSCTNRCMSRKWRRPRFGARIQLDKQKTGKILCGAPSPWFWYRKRPQIRRWKYHLIPLDFTVLFTYGKTQYNQLHRLNFGDLAPCRIERQFSGRTLSQKLHSANAAVDLRVGSGDRVAIWHYKSFNSYCSARYFRVLISCTRLNCVTTNWKADKFYVDNFAIYCGATTVHMRGCGAGHIIDPRQGKFQMAY